MGFAIGQMAQKNYHGRTFWKWVRPTFHMFFIFCENIVSLSLGQLVFYVRWRMSSVKENQGVSQSIFKSGKIRESRPFWRKSGTHQVISLRIRENIKDKMMFP